MNQQPAPVGSFPPQRANYGGVPDALILAGAAVGVAQTALMLIMFVFQFFLFQSAFNRANPGPDGFPDVLVWMPVMFGVFALVSLVGAILAFLARNELKRTNGTKGATRAIVAGAIMIVGMGMVGGVLVLIGGILASQNQPRQ